MQEFKPIELITREPDMSITVHEDYSVSTKQIPKHAYFRLDNTPGYSQTELDFHNAEFEKFYAEKYQIYRLSCYTDWSCLRKDLAGQYFKQFMSKKGENTMAVEQAKRKESLYKNMTVAEYDKLVDGYAESLYRMISQYASNRHDARSILDDICDTVNESINARSNQNV